MKGRRGYTLTPFLTHFPPMQAPLQVAIVGCGTAGQAAAILLCRQGHAVTMFERSPTLGPVGAGLLLQPTGLAILAELGLLEAILALGCRVHRLLGVTPTARRVLDVSYRDLRSDLFGLGIHRGALFTTLQNAVSTSGVELIVGRTIHHTETIGEKVRLIDAHDNVVGEFDLVLACDGARSSLRQTLPIVQRDRAYAWGALWMVASDVDSRFEGTLAQVYRGTRAMIGFLPSGRLHTNDPAPTVSMFWSVATRDVAGIRATGIETLKKQMRELTSQADPILEQLRSLDQLVHAEYRDVVLTKPYSGRVVFLGDAAHAMSPQLGQGANLALLDAMAISNALQTHADIHDALRAYDTSRRANIRFYQRASRWLTPWFQSDYRVLGPIRDAFMGPLSGLPLVRQQMLQSLVGAKTGLASSMPLPAINGQ